MESGWAAQKNKGKIVVKFKELLRRTWSGGTVC